LFFSLDCQKRIENKLLPFILKKKLQSKVIFLNDINEDYWIKAIDLTWSGAILATIIFNKVNRKFFEKSLDYKTLEKEVQVFIH